VEIKAFHSDGTGPYNIRADKGEVYLIYAALEAYKGNLKKDMETQYGGSEKYSTEDDMFLGAQIRNTAKLMFDFEDSDARTAINP
jgi:hypothetical protein